MANVQINYKSVFNAAAIFLLGYAIVQYSIFSLGIQPNSYILMDEQNSFNVLIIGLASFFGLYSRKNYTVNFLVCASRQKLMIVLFFLMATSLVLSILYPWGIHGQKLTLGDSFKFFTRHAYSVISIIVFITCRRVRFKLIIVDVFFLFIDPTRVMFAESVIPKIFYLFTLLNNKSIKEKKIFWMGVLILVLLLMYVQSFRHGMSILGSVGFAIYSEAVHSTYTAVQNSDFYSNYPYHPIEDFGLYYSEKKSPLGGYYLPGYFFYSGNIWLDGLVAFLFFRIFKLVLMFVAKYKPIYIFCTIGIIVIMQKFSPLVLFKMLLAIYISFAIVSIVTSLKKR